MIDPTLQPLLFVQPRTVLDQLPVAQVQQLHDALTVYLDHRRTMAERYDTLVAAQQQRETIVAAMDHLPVISSNGH